LPNFLASIHFFSNVSSTVYTYTLSLHDALPIYLADRYASLLVLGGGSNLVLPPQVEGLVAQVALAGVRLVEARPNAWIIEAGARSEEHTSELQSRENLVCRLLLEKKKNNNN